jgi:cytidylate kinase
VLSRYDLADLYSIDTIMAAQAIENLQLGRVVLLAISGKLGSGKDSSAPLLMEALGVSLSQHEFFARPLKDEVQQVIDILASSETLQEGVLRLSATMGAKVNLMDVVAGYLYRGVQAGEITSSYQRTPEVRSALQFWGTEVRRAQDEDYWVKLAMKSTLALLASGVSVFVTDARFINEIEAILSVDGYAVRLDISQEVQKERIKARDGIIPSEEALNHKSELELDDFTRFSARVSTDTLSKAQVVQEVMRQLHDSRI